MTYDFHPAAREKLSDATLLELEELVSQLPGMQYQRL